MQLQARLALTIFSGNKAEVRTKLISRQCGDYWRRLCRYITPAPAANTNASSCIEACRFRGGTYHLPRRGGGECPLGEGVFQLDVKYCEERTTCEDLPVCGSRNSGWQFKIVVSLVIKVSAFLAQWKVIYYCWECDILLRVRWLMLFDEAGSNFVLFRECVRFPNFPCHV